LDRLGLFKRTHRFYFSWLAVLLAGLVAVYAALPHLTSVWMVMVAGVTLAFLSVQFGFLMHDAGHGAVFDAPWMNDLFGLICGDLLAGLSYRWWAPHHREHHVNPNSPTADPDIVDLDVVFAYTERSAAARRGLRGLIVRHQHNLIFPGFLGQGFAMLFYSIRYLVGERPPYWWAELIVMLAHYVAYGFLVFTLLPVRSAVPLVVVHRLLVGLYTSLVVATNHMGMARADLELLPDYIARQAATSRNVRNPAWLDFFFAGLNFQIEHHLFSAMPRPHLRQAKLIVERFCAERGVIYHETSLWIALMEMRQYLRSIGDSARRNSSDLPGGSHSSEPAGLTQ